MNMQSIKISLFICLIFSGINFAQDAVETVSSTANTSLFSDQLILPLKMSYSNKKVRKETNDSTYIKSALSYKLEGSDWTNLNIELRARGNYRRNNCYFPPIKLKINKAASAGTLFEGHKKLKLVMPCLIQKDNSDNMVKEYLAYKLFELISPYCFKVRMVDIEFEEVRGKKIKVHHIKGFLIEDDKKVAKRFTGNIYKRNVHPLQQDALASVRNAVFQFMIGNTDFSTAYLHNIKLVFIDKKIIPIPFDFDMAGFVNTSYAVVSEINGWDIGLESVTSRKYRGFKRDEQLFFQVRKEFIANKANILAAMDECEVLFDNPNEFYTARKYIESFFNIIVNDGKFQNQILKQARTK